jgi:hypothetical protein
MGRPKPENHDKFGPCHQCHKESGPSEAPVRILDCSDLSTCRCPEYQRLFVAACRSGTKKLLKHVGTETRRFGTMRSPKWTQSVPFFFENNNLTELNELGCKHVLDIMFTGGMVEVLLRNVNVSTRRSR